MKHLCMCALVILVAGCSGTPAPPSAKASADIHKAAAATEAGHYREAIDSYHKAATEAPPDSAGEAVFQAAYLLAYYENSQRDYSQALQGFEDYIKRFPKGPRLKEAKNFRAILRAILDLRAENANLNQKIDQLKQIDIRHEEKREK